MPAKAATSLLCNITSVHISRKIVVESGATVLIVQRFFLFYFVSSQTMIVLSVILQTMIPRMCLIANYDPENASWKSKFL
jgi:hypothetical protein